MSKVVILGNSIAAVKASEEIHALDQSIQFTIISFDGYYPYNRDLFPHVISQEIQTDQLFYKSQDFYEKNGIEVITDKKVTRINPKTKKIYTEDRQQIDFDILMVGDVPEHKFSEVKGTNKTGVFGFRRLNDIEHISHNVSLVDSVVIQSDSLIAIEIAIAIASRGKEVILINSSKGIFSQIKREQDFVALDAFLQKQKIHVIQNEEIVEILGEGELRAIKLSSGKVFATDMVLLGNQRLDLRSFSEVPTSIESQVDFKGQFETENKDFFVFDMACQSQSNITDFEEFVASDILEEQGAIIASHVTGSEIATERGTYVRTISAQELSFTWLGRLTQEALETVREQYNPEEKSQKLAFFTNNVCQAALLINAEKEKDKFLRFIHEAVSLVDIEDEFKVISASEVHLEAQEIQESKETPNPNS